MTGLTPPMHQRGGASLDRVLTASLAHRANPPIVYETKYVRTYVGDGTDKLVAQREMPRQTSILGQTGISRFPISAINYGAVGFLIRYSRLADLGALIRPIIT